MDDCPVAHFNRRPGQIGLRTCGLDILDSQAHVLNVARLIKCCFRHSCRNGLSYTKSTESLHVEVQVFLNFASTSHPIHPRQLLQYVSGGMNPNGTDVLHVAGLLDRREVLPDHLHAGRCDPPELHLLEPFPLGLVAFFANVAASVRPLAVSRYF